MCGGAVTDALAGADLAHLQDAALEMHHGLERIVAVARRLSAIERDARPHQVVGIGAAEAGYLPSWQGSLAPSVVWRATDRKIYAASRSSDVAARRRRRMAHHQREGHGLPKLARVGHLVDVFGRRAQAGSCRCRYARRSELLAARGAEGGPLGDLVGAVQHGAKVVGAVGLGRSRHQSGKDIDDGGRGEARARRGPRRASPRRRSCSPRAPAPARQAPCRGRRHRP